ncbi:addiction module protein [Nostoc sp. C110]|uniref:addiction module protein n=1 Tax=Nostoc sp. C110 TaxID=3349876 RepID=UPI00370DBCF4
MTLEQLEAEVLALPKDSQVILLARLLERLGQESGIDQEIAASWAEEAQKRDEDMNTNQITVFRLKKCFNVVGDLNPLNFVKYSSFLLHRIAMSF